MTLTVRKSKACLMFERRCVLFSTNKRGFVLDAEALPELRDITATTLDPDVRRSPPPHLCWRADRA